MGTTAYGYGRLVAQLAQNGMDEAGLTQVAFAAGQLSQPDADETHDYRQES